MSSGVMSSGVTPVGRVAYPHLFKARKRNDKQDPRYSVTLVYDQSVDLTTFKAVVRKVVQEAYPNGVPGGFRNPFRPGSDRRGDDGTMPEGFKETDTFVEFWRYEDNGQQPTVGPERDAAGNLPALGPNDVYAGMTGRVSFRAYCYGKGKDHGNKGVNIGLEAFQKIADGKPIGNAPIDANKAFGGDVPAAGASFAAPPVAPPVAPPAAAPAVSVDDIVGNAAPLDGIPF